jgi:hypothetical protein
MTPASWHLENFLHITEQLRRSTNEITILFMHPYRRTQENLNVAAQKFSFEWREAVREERLDLMAALTGIVDEHRMQLTVCS